MADITALDYVLLPFYLIIIYKIAFYCRNKFYPIGHPFRPYFVSGLTVKIVGAIFIGLFYNYYYGSGDTFYFFYHAKVINSTISNSPDTWFRLITHNIDQTNFNDTQALSEMFWYDDIASYVTSCLGAFIGLFCFTKYLIINIVIASIVFTGMWLMFLSFANSYTNTKLIAIAVLFMPGPVVWGSGLFKDSFCMFSIGCLIYCIYVLFEKGKFKLGLVLLGLISIALLLLIKAYILIALMPVLLFKVLLIYKKRSKNSLLKQIVFYIVLLVTCFGLYKGVAIAADAVSQYNTENVLTTIKDQKDYLLSTNDNEGSFYNLGDFEPTIRGVARLILPAINVTLFRPYLWEGRSAIQLLNATESSLVLIFTLYVIFTTNPFKVTKYIYNDPNLIMCLAFTLIFAFFVGISSYNFGALSRYKIPCTPFYMLFLAMLLSKNKTITELTDET